MSSRLVFGVGINDVNYKIHIKEPTGEVYKDGSNKYRIVWRCPYYSKWVSMLGRCYDEKYLKKNPSYKGCTVCEEWKYFSNFKSWMEKQAWEGKHLDKDLLAKGNRIYSPETCVFIDAKVNNFIASDYSSRGSNFLGVSVYNDKFRVRIQNILSGKYESFGLFNNEKDAAKVWLEQKHVLSCSLADSEYVDNEVVAEALRNRYKLRLDMWED